MTGSSMLRAGVRKEARALLVPWAACAAALAVSSLIPDSRLMGGWLVFLLASITLAALSIGHEYTHGTLPLLLSLPTDRRRLLLMKLSVLVPTIATLVALALAGLHSPDEHGPVTIAAAVWVCCTAAAPWLTMLCRNPLAGVVFAIGIAGQLHLASELIAFARYGRWLNPTATQTAFHDTLFLWGLIATAAIAAVAGWRTFMRLEAAEGVGVEMRLPAWLSGAGTGGEARAAGARPRHPAWLLAKKEIRLQHLTLAATAVGLPFWIAALFFNDGTARAFNTLGGVGVIYGAALVLLVGSLASAEERRLGTLEWQGLLPQAAWRQWAIKMATLVVLTMVLGVGLPILASFGEFGFNAGHAGAIVMLMTASLYVSSLCRSGVRALAVAGPVVLVIVQFIGTVNASINFTTTPFIASFVGCVALAWWFAFDNHRSAARDPKRVAWQMLWLSAGPIAAVIIARS